uniref:Undecaprenyl-phosphate galactose phosphotransferase n=1 Tax=Rhodopseudomonas palustris (strain BisA53) TaxID=316055 RepID=Q07KV0_RHOP5
MSDTQVRSVPQSATLRAGPKHYVASFIHRRIIAVTGLLVAGDLTSGVAAIAGAALFEAALPWAGPAFDANLWSERLPVWLLLLVAGYVGVGLYSVNARGLLERFRSRAVATTLFVLTAGLLTIREAPVIDVPALLVAGGLALVFGTWAEHFAVRALIQRGMWRVPAVILGDDPADRELARQLTANPDWGLLPIERPASPALVRPSDGGSALLVTDPASIGDPERLRQLGFDRVLLVSRVGPIPTFGVQVRHFNGCIALEFGNRRVGQSRTAKRAIDLAIAIPALVVAAPLIAAAAAAIKMTDRGPALYSQTRVGAGGRPIRVLKLRTMYLDADQRLEGVLAENPAARAEWERFFKLSNDPRILPGIGHFLRRTSLDELPQFWNVIRGDMSMVGPRPFPDYHMKSFDPEFRALRVSVPPGLTGLWQISARSDGDLEVQHAQDSLYIRHRSLWLDLYILIATVPAVLAPHGAK